VVRIVASDAPGNPPALALTGSRDSTSFLVDNAPPSIAASLDRKTPARIRVLVKDDASPVRRLELSTDGGRWEEVLPRDGIADSPEETYEIPLPGAVAGQVVVLRATDLLGNVATARVDIP
jgi:hypothetical protein